MCNDLVTRKNNTSWQFKIKLQQVCYKMRILFQRGWSRLDVAMNRNIPSLSRLSLIRTIFIPYCSTAGWNGLLREVVCDLIHAAQIVSSFISLGQTWSGIPAWDET